MGITRHRPGARRTVGALLTCALLVAWAGVPAPAAEATGWSPLIAWSEGYSGSWAAVVESLPDGSVIVGGQFYGQVAFGPSSARADGPPDAFVAKADPGGSWAWAAFAGTEGADVDALAALPDGSVLVAGRFSEQATFGSTVLESTGISDAYVARLDPGGQWDWAIGGEESGATGFTGIAGLPDGSALFAGAFEESVSFGTTTLEAAGFEDIFVARLTPSGTWAWATRAGGPSHEAAYAIAATADGGAIVTGDFGWQAGFGSTTLTSRGGSDVFVARLGPTGSWEWAAQAGASDWSFGNGIDVTVTPDGSAVVTGSYTGRIAFGAAVLSTESYDEPFIAKTDPTGAWQWATSGATRQGQTWARGVAVRADGSAVVVGGFDGRVAFGSTLLTNTYVGVDRDNVFVAGTDADGTWRWATSTTGLDQVAAGVRSDETAAGVVSQPDGSWLVAGEFEGSARFGPTTVNAGTDGRCAFLAKVGSDGLWTASPPARGSIQVVSPADGAPVSTGGGFGVTALTTGFRAGTPATLTLGETEMAVGAVSPTGIVRLESVSAAAGSYVVHVGTATTTVLSEPFHLTIKPFGITGHRTVTPPGDRLPRERFTIATGNWSPGTDIALARAFFVVAGHVRVRARGTPVSLVVPRVPGEYQVRVVTRYGWAIGRPSAVITQR